MWSTERHRLLSQLNSRSSEEFVFPEEIITLSYQAHGLFRGVIMYIFAACVASTVSVDYVNVE